MIKVIKFKKLKGDKKKYSITFDKNGKKYTRKFGSAGMSDFTKHKDRERRERYISRHKKDLKTNDPMRPGYLSMYILWNKPTVSASLADYKRRLNTYNKTGKFPKGITGSKKLSFGAVDPCSAEALSNLPGDIQELVKKQCAASIIQDAAKKMNPKKTLYEALKRRGLQRYKNAAKTTQRPQENMHFLNELWTNLDPVNDFTAKWLTRASKVLIKSDFDFKNRNFWWKVIEDQIQSMSEMWEGTGDPYEDLPEDKYEYYIQCQDAIFIILNKVGYRISYDQFWAEESLRWWRSKRTNTFGKKKLSFGKKQPKKSTGSKVPSNVVNKALYLRIKAKIRRDVNKKKRRWGAYDSGRLVREYKAKGGKYSGGKGKTDLGRWYKEKWVDACAWPKRKSCGRKTKEKIAYCRPSKKVDSKTPKLVQSLSKSQIKSRCAKKKRNPRKRITSFGKSSIIPVKGTLFNKLPEDILYELQGPRAATQISTNYRKYELNKLYNSSKVFGEFNKKSLEWVKKLSTFISNENKNEIKWRKLLITILDDAGFRYTMYYAFIQRGIPMPVLDHDTERLRRSVRNDQVTIKLLVEIIKYVGVIYYKLGCNDLYLFIMQNDMSNITRDNVMKFNRVTKTTRECFGSWNKTNFGVTTPDRDLAYGDGSWTLHCSYHDWGAHSTLRYKLIATPGIGDYSYHYGIHNDGTLKFWATGRARQTPLNPYLKQKLKDYYNQYCNKIELTKQANQDFYITDQYGSNLKFGNVDSMRKNMFNQIFSSGNVSENIKNTIEKRCKRGFSDSFCQSIFTDLILSIYFTVISKSKLNSNRERNIREIKNLIPRGFKPTIFRISKEQHSKINEFLYLMQDHSYGNFKNARMASLTYEFINSI